MWGRCQCSGLLKMKSPRKSNNGQAFGPASFVSDEMAQEAINGLQAAMGATTMVRAGLGPDGKREYREVPDYSIRLPACVHVLSWKFGKPVLPLALPPTGAGRQGEGLADLGKLLAADQATAERVINALVAQSRSVVQIESSKGGPE
jgi:hypothetical protein